MAVRLIINPMVSTLLPNGLTFRRPKVEELVDTGRTPLKTVDEDGNPVTVQPRFVHRSVMDGTEMKALSMVVGVDMSAIDADPECISLFEHADPTRAQAQAFLRQTPNDLGWSKAKQIRMRDKLISLGANMDRVTADTPLWKIVNRLGQSFNAKYDVRGFVPVHNKGAV